MSRTMTRREHVRANLRSAALDFGMARAHVLDAITCAMKGVLRVVHGFTPRTWHDLTAEWAWPNTDTLPRSRSMDPAPLYPGGSEP